MDNILERQFGRWEFAANQVDETFGDIPGVTGIVDDIIIAVFHDRSAKVLPPLAPQQAVRILDPVTKVWTPARVESPVKHPGSHPQPHPWYQIVRP